MFVRLEFNSQHINFGFWRLGFETGPSNLIKKYEVYEVYEGVANVISSTKFAHVCPLV